MHRSDAKEKRARVVRYSAIANTMRNSMVRKKSTEKAKEIFSTPPYYLTIKKNNQEKENKENE